MTHVNLKRDHSAKPSSMGSPLSLSAPVASGQQAIGENVVGLLAKEKGKMQIAKHIHLMAGLRFAFESSGLQNPNWNSGWN